MRMPPSTTGLFIKKDLATVIKEANDPNLAHGSQGLKRSLGAFNLMMLGVGAIIGAGIFSLTGAAAANYAGPGIAYSFAFGGILCTFAGLCYAELAAMIPVAGSAYTYTYTTMGELVAWIIGWDLILEYAFGAVVVSIAWSGYLVEVIHSLEHLFPGAIFHLTDTALHFTKGPFETFKLASGAETTGYWNIPATLVAIGCASILYRGITESAWVNNLIVILKVTIVCVFVLLGISLISKTNLFVGSHGGLGALVPDPVALAHDKWTPLDRLLHLLFHRQPMHYGWGMGGVLTGAGVVFFAYIGFDAVSTTAQEAKNPQRDLPIGILGSLAICTVLYILVAITLTGVVRFDQLGVSAPIAVGINKIVELRQWSPAGANTFSFFVKLGALAGLTSVILVMMLGQTRVFYAMAKDGLLPWFDHTHEKYQTPHKATVVTGVFVAVCGGCMPMHLVGELVSIGTLLAFLLVCLGVPILRRSNPDTERPFKVKGPWIIGILGAASCLYVMTGLPPDTWLRLVIWLAIGFGVYFGYSKKHSLLRKHAR